MVTEGLTATEAQKRSRAQGPNTLEYRPPRSTWSRLVTQFRNPGSSLGWGIFAGNPVANAAVGILMIVQLGFIYLPLMQDVFDTAPLDSVFWLVLLGLAAAFFLSVEGVKFFLRRREKVEM